MLPVSPRKDPAGLAALRRRIALLERRTAVTESAGGGAAEAWRLGLDALDAALPERGLAAGGLHEAGGSTAGDGPAAACFLTALLARLERRDGRHAVLVCQSRTSPFGRLYGPGWRDLGLEPADLLLLSARRDRDVSWAMEEGLRSAGLAAVLGEVESLDFTLSRRLALAARESLTPALLLRRDGLGPASAAFSRWRVAALPPDREPAPDAIRGPGQAGSTDPFDNAAPGLPRWRLELLRCRGGRPMTCTVEWNRETGDFGVAAALADRPAAPRAAARRPALARAAG